MTGKRLFFGLGLSSQAEQAIDDWLHTAVQSKRALVKKTNLHLTLAFLAEVDSEREHELVCFAEQIEFTPFSLTFSATGYWPHNGIFYLKPDESPEPLLSLANKLRDKGEALGLYHNQLPYSPHITLLRRAKPEPLVSRPFGPLTVRFDRFSLYHSHSTDEGLRYDPLKTFLATN